MNKPFGGGALPPACHTLLPLVRKPGRYLGGELHAVCKDWGVAEVRFALIFPDLYEIGMSHQGLQILYHLLNARSGVLAERAYAPDLDMEAALRERGLPLFSLESGRPLAEFDILGITLPYELCYTNILTILELAGLPFRSAGRTETMPLVVGGGPCAFHPEPVADFFDAILLGDGEDAVVEIADCVAAGKREGLSRQAMLDRLAGIEGVYVPSRFEPLYGADGRFLGMRPLDPDRAKVRRRVLPDIEQTAELLTRPLVPATKIVHDRLGVEIARGCTRGCRFCQAGIIYRPVRERSPETVLRLAREAIAASGFEEVALLSLSTGDYACLGDLLATLMREFAQERVAVSLPSMRVGTLTPRVMEEIRRVRKTGFTIAPEAGSERLRQVINKGITEPDLLETCRAAFALGWKQVKLYFMFGLPTEKQEDVDAIVDLAGKALATGGRGREITVSAATFVPKPHTPFQWETQLPVEAGFAHIDQLKQSLRRKGFHFKWHDPRHSFLEGVMSRGDRRLALVIEEAWRRGARLDAWSDHFRLDVWQEAAEAAGVALAPYVAARPLDAPLPWDHLDAGVDDAFLRAEREKAFACAYTPDCRVHGCQKCGLCDFKTVKPVVWRGARDQGIMELEGAREEREAPPQAGEKRPKVREEPAPCFPYTFFYSRAGVARFLGHLELIQIFYRAFRRMGLPLVFSQGFNPIPRVTFSAALPVGMESLCEYCTVELTEPIASPESRIAGWNAKLPEGLVITGVMAGRVRQPERPVARYEIEAPFPVNLDALARFLATEACPVTVTRKGEPRTIDIRPLVVELDALGPAMVRLALKPPGGGAGSAKPHEVLAAVLGLPVTEGTGFRMRKVAEEGVNGQDGKSTG